MLPVDHLINNTRLNWNEDYVESQSDLISRAQSVAKESLQKAADADKQRWDRRAQAGPIPVRYRVLLKQCAFTGRHKLSNHYGDTSYVVVNCKTDRNIYVTRSTEMRNKSGHVKSGKSTSKSIGDGFALKY